MTENERDPHLSLLFSEAEETLVDESYSVSVDARLEKEVATLGLLRLAFAVGTFAVVVLLALALSLVVQPLNSWITTPLFNLDSALMSQLIGPAVSPAALMVLILGWGLLVKKKLFGR